MTNGKPLRKATVKEVFENPSIETFRDTDEINDVTPYADVSLLHERRILYYPSYNNKLYSFNVDTRVNTEIDIGMYCSHIASLTGIDCGIKAVFWNSDDKCTYSLNNDNTVTKVSERQNEFLTTIFPSTSNPNNIQDAVFKYGHDIMKDGKKINTDGLIEFSYYSVIRVYKDVFLAYDKVTGSWVLFRMIVS